MQVLNSTDIVPNLTLRRLIHFWADSDLLCPRSLLRIVELAKSSEEGREYLANLEGFLPMMVRILKSSNEIEVVELVVTALDLILITKGVKDRLKNINFDDSFFSPFSFILQKGNLDARINTARVLKSLAEFDNDYRREIAEQNGLLSERRITESLLGNIHRTTS
ncbi:hypothetical protein L2E82_01155 [Cichorium intybus]|uniref:Uncharacterized protein n=1 Tax=Cichorium intybus TaxID=13427 RepID=A0ACB9GYT3_CICIN|nr:hypothetical protein L2E82_01155 [Cichorium intybus]